MSTRLWGGSVRPRQGRPVSMRLEEDGPSHHMEAKLERSKGGDQKEIDEVGRHIRPP
jgi:hypothetical protein